MFEIGWSELLILAIVTLVFVGPKELPVFLRTIGRYAGSIKRQAADFRAQFDEAMREAELDQMRKEMEAMQASVNAEVMRAQSTINDAAVPPSSAAQAPAQPSAPAVAEAAPPAALPPMPAPPRMEP